MKKVISILLIVFVLALGACKKEKVDTGKLNEYFKNTVEEYNKAENVQFKVTMQTGEVVETIEIKYSFKDGKVVALAAVLTDSEGTVSAYIKDGYAYLARYNSNKVKSALSDSEASSIASNYSFASYVERLTEIFNSSFFNASSIVSESNGVYNLSCDLNNLSVPEGLSDEEMFEAENDLELLRSMTSMELSLEVSDKAIKKAEGTFVKNEKTSKITLEFISKEAFTVEIPNESQYK